jgi:hypothetical protein
MQLLNSPSDKTFPEIQKALESARLSRYFRAAGNNDQTAFRFYLWNCALCEAFHLSLHVAEIVCRNAIHQALIRRGDPKWFENHTFRTLLEGRFRSELNDAVEKERRQHGLGMTPNHVVSALTFGFWEHLTTKRFERFLWAKGIHGSFPHAPNKSTYEDLHGLIESVRRWRNRIAHHRAIFDKGPTRKHQNAIELINWVCDSTGQWVSAESKVPGAVTLRPK